MSNKDKIAEIFKQSFEDFEVDVNPKIWDNVQNAIKTNAGGTSATSVGAGAVTKAILLKIVAGLVLVSVAITTYLINKDKTSNKQITITNNYPLLNNKQTPSKIDKIAPSKLLISKKISKATPTLKTQHSKLKTQNSKPNTQILNLASKTSSPKLSSSNLKPPTQESKTTNLKHPTSNVQPKNTQPKINTKIVCSILKGKAPLDVDFSVENNENIVSYLWDFDDGVPVSNEEAPYHTFVNPGIYKVSLTVIDKNANSKNLIQFIEVLKNVTSSLGKIPNIFTPNGDGENDIYKIEGKNIKIFNARILNTAGKTVYEWNSIEDSWNGNDLAGNKLPTGSYLIKGLAIGEDDRQFPIKSFITLRR